MAVIVSLAFGLGVVLTYGWRRGGTFVAGATGATIVASVVVASLALIAGTGQNVGLDRVPDDLSRYGLRAVELVVPAKGNLLLGDSLESFWDERRHGSNPTETSNYLGLLTIALALAWLAVAWRRRAVLPSPLRAATIGFATVVVTALVLALPSPMSVLGHDIWAPSRLLWELTPAFRVPTRWIPVAMAALVPLAALGLQAAVSRASKGRSGNLASVSVVAAAMLISLAELPLSAAEPLLRTDAPGEYEAVASTPEGIVAEYPLVHDVDRLFWQRDYERPLLNADAPGTAADEARRVLVDPGAAGTAEALAFLGVTAIVTHPDALDFAGDLPDASNRVWGPGYELVARELDGTSVWRVVAPAAPALVTLPGGFSGPIPTAAGGVGYPLVSPAGVGTIEFIARAPSVAQLSFLATPPPGPKRVLRLADGQTERSFELDGPTQISIPVEIPRGRSYLLAKTDPPATSEEDAVVLSAPRVTTVAVDPQLRAVGISSDPGL